MEIILTRAYYRAPFLSGNFLVCPIVLALHFIIFSLIR